MTVDEDEIPPDEAVLQLLGQYRQHCEQRWPHTHMATGRDPTVDLHLDGATDGYTRKDGTAY